jgi:hypothetical protein
MLGSNTEDVQYAGGGYGLLLVRCHFYFERPIGSLSLSFLAIALTIQHFNS